MNKQDIQKRVLQNGEPLSLDKFEWDEESKVFSTRENNLVLGFPDVHGVNFKTGSHCTFKTSSDCTFNTDHACTFDTAAKCVIVRRDVFEVIELEKCNKIKLNGNGIKGFTYVTDKVKVVVEGKEFWICKESARALKLID